MEIKYEAVFGPQELFDGAPEDAVIAIKRPFISRVRSEKIYFFSTTFDAVMEAGSSFNFNNVILKKSEYAERRIIRTPTWSVADQKEGKLPPVGSRYLGKDGKELTCVLIDAFYDVWGVNDDLTMFVWERSRISPIETPEEKAARLRSEWISKAYVDFHRLGCELEALQKEQIKVIYDAMLSGDLPVPVKGGE